MTQSGHSAGYVYPGYYRIRWLGALNFRSSIAIRWRSSTASSSAYMAAAKAGKAGKHRTFVCIEISAYGMRAIE